MNRSVSVMLLVAAVAIAGCRPGAPVYNATDVAYSPIAASSSLSRADYKNAIIRAGTQRGWTFQDAGPGHLIGNLAVRGAWRGVGIRGRRGAWRGRCCRG